ncbi:putative deacetylase LmbE-like domain-containing protein [Hygrophoropsis aurantiaca]|uniref:Deacetylase LmbE-like domain-containing protein n=1 Tax=Hygrophoropsis aurantiaca TaxID=72124 RepID=A0ACB7ZUS9_9AGAM|nr:putative deacetylase LmbE-like domain-containing protein [Hygrophoropsis aurantiaca]
MFFAPTILSLRARADVFSLCLSTGNAEGHGETRQRELAQSLSVLGIDEKRRWVVDHPALQDNFTAKWDAGVIAKTIRPYIIDNNITTILTFDKQGISQHPNHVSLPLGAAHLISSLKSSTAPTTRLFTLVTVPVVPKYTGLLSALLARLDIVFQRALERLVGLPSSSGVNHQNALAVFVSGINEYIAAIQAMSAHKSQLEWFRYLYIGFSRYMWVNEWIEVRPDTGVSV